MIQNFSSVHTCGKISGKSALGEYPGNNQQLFLLPQLPNL
jgi:hypothetical protein